MDVIGIILIIHKVMIFTYKTELNKIFMIKKQFLERKLKSDSLLVYVTKKSEFAKNLKLIKFIIKKYQSFSNFIKF